MLDTFISIPKRIVAEKMASKYFFTCFYYVLYSLMSDTYECEQNRRLRTDMCHETENSDISLYPVRYRLLSHKS